VGHVPGFPLARAYAAVLACGPGAALSHGSAGTLWAVFKHWEMPFEVTVPQGGDRDGIHIHRSRTLVRRDFRTRVGIYVTSPARTVLDLAPRLSDRALGRVVNEFRLANQLRINDLAELLQRAPSRPGASRLRSLVEVPDGPTRSEFEDAFVRFTRAYGLPRPVINIRVVGHEVDALFAAQRLIVELDGYRFHGTRTSFEVDRERDADTLAAGYGTVRLTWKRLMSKAPEEAERLATILRSRGA
ncbi:MAG: hypothetical protein M3Y17_13495, partial [Actinomycetota bacterium]|nr:hypothetical protein [Actinomycetota bacterium]